MPSIEQWFSISNDDPNHEWIVFTFFYFDWEFYSKRRVASTNDDAKRTTHVTQP